MNFSKPKSRKGFTLLEICAVVVLIGILAMLIIPNIPAIKRKGEDNEMKAKAHQFNQAMASYMSDQSVRTALTTWRGKSNDERYQLIREYLSYSPATIADFIKEGYTVTFPDDPRNQTGVTVTTPEGENLQYQ